MQTLPFAPVPPYASVGRRFLAVLLDALILFIPSMLASKAFPVVGSILIGLLYFPILESSRMQATLGKRALDIQVADLNGRRLTLKAALIRYVMKFVSTLVLFLGYLLVFFTERKQTLHDLVAEAIVVNGRNDAPVADAWMEQMRSIFREEGTAISGAGSTASLASRAEELERLHALHQRGALSEEEFQREKRRILGT